MSVGQEWTKAIRGVHGLFLAIRTFLGSAWADKSGKSSIARTVHVSVMRSTVITDHRVLAELERRKNIAHLNNVRSMVK